MQLILEWDMTCDFSVLKQLNNHVQMKYAAMYFEKECTFVNHLMYQYAFLSYHMSKTLKL